MPRAEGLTKCVKESIHLAERKRWEQDKHANIHAKVKRNLQESPPDTRHEQTRETDIKAAATCDEYTQTTQRRRTRGMVRNRQLG